MSALQYVPSVDLLRKAQCDLEVVIRYGIAQIDKLDAEKIVEAHTLIGIVLDAQKAVQS